MCQTLSRYWGYNINNAKQKQKYPCPHYVNITLYYLSSIVHYVITHSEILFCYVQNLNKKLWVNMLS